MPFYVIRVWIGSKKTTLQEEERLQDMKNAFVTSRPLKGLKVGIIDDVLTTGATMSVYAKALKNNGVVHVIAVTLATPIIN
ncbi:phosphoribosyltransferase family protein [Candidatus Marinimicrobia bacterium]|nr:phosphoribosyltransferase family protein [Candidatus Neomarinimicrobiota bacterium]